MEQSRCALPARPKSACAAEVGDYTVPLTSLDRELLKRCLGRQPGSWNEFVDRYLGLIYHVINHASHLRSVPLRPEDVEDLAADVLLQIVADDYAVLRQFRKESSLATYLTVIARRICVQELAKRQATREVHVHIDGKHIPEPEAEEPGRGVGLETLEEVAKLLKRLPARERQVVRLFYLEGRTYEEISTKLSIPVNTIGPILSRAKKKLRESHKIPLRPAAAPARRPAQPKPESE
jgi:RNA polymerase sigma-70 factor, ECF subfamily